jgi:hypothetical protein
MPKKTPKELVAHTRDILSEIWRDISSQTLESPLPDILSDEKLAQAIRRSISCKTKTYRYVLPTQLLIKLADHSLDCRFIQAKKGIPRAFDARTICHQVIVPFDQDNHQVLGGSSEPYVSNPLRVPEVSSRHANAQRDKRGWRDLCLVLNAAEKKQDPDFTKQVFLQVMIEIYRRLSEVKITYPAPIRISLEKTIELIENFLRELSGGDRAQAVASALFLLIGKRFGLFQEVRREAINAADSATGLAADLECVTEQGEIVLAVEVKDQELTIAQIERKLKTSREKKIAEILFIAQKGVSPGEQGGLRERVEREFARGQNVYLFELKNLARVVLALMGEKTRPEFLRLVGQHLDQFRSDLRHRQTWRDLLTQI